MNKKTILILKTLIVLMLVTSTGITSVEASSQTVTIDVVPDDAGSVYIWKTIGSDLGFIGIVTKKSSFEFDTSDNIIIQPTDRADLIKGDYRYVRQCDDVECITGTYNGPLYQDRSTWNVKVYYELPKDTEPPVINSVTLSKTSVNVGDKIEVTVDTTDNVGVTRVTADNGYGSSYTTLIMINKNIWKGQVTAAEGLHSVFVVSYDITKNYGTDASQSYTAVRTSTPTPTPTSSLHIVNLKLSSSVDVITATVTTTGSGKLGIDLDTKSLVFTKDVTNDGETKAEIKASLGEHTVCVRDIDNNKEIKCESVEIKPTSTPNPTSTSTPAPTPSSTQTQTQTKLKASDTVDTYGRINIDSDPNEADIYLNNILYGTTPYSADVEIGSYTLKLTKNGYNDFTKKVIVKESSPTDVTVTLIPINDTSNTVNNQSNQSAMLSNENAKQNDGDSKALLINNLTKIAIVAIVAIVFIVCVAIYSRKNIYTNYSMIPTHPPSNGKSMIILNRVNK